MPARHFLATAAIFIAVIMLPVIGAAMAGHDLSRLLEFPPPLEIPSNYPRFSWLAAGMVVAVVAAFVASWMFAARASRAAGEIQRRATGTRFPIWGWVALGWTVAWWALAWTRFAWFSELQDYTFAPLWLGFIVTVNALTHARTGTCLMRRDPRRWLALFGASAVLWWVFEWLNRFVRNWHYLGVESVSAREYAIHATLCFATVLPALAAVSEWLGSHPRWIERARAGPVWSWLGTHSAGWLLVAAGLVALGLAGARPQLFYPALWVAPLALLLGADILARRPDAALELAAGDWRRAGTWMFAALICGFFWELWNWHSLAKWIYTVPGVERWHVFEMPLLGYAGYLPFGLECLLVVERMFVQPPSAGGETPHRTSPRA